MFTLQDRAILLFLYLSAQQTGARVPFFWLDFKIHQPGSAVNVFEGRNSLLFLQVSSNLGRKALIDENGPEISMVFY